MQIKDIGEQGLLKRLFAYCDRDKNGDDGAILSVSKGKQLVVSTDLLVEGVHFSSKTLTPEAIGHRAATANLSDIAAMGGKPLHATVGLSLRKETEVAWVEKLYEGMSSLFARYSCTIVGGDVTRSQTNTIAITILGEVNPKQIIYRNRARVGDVIVVTGNHGLSRGGLALLTGNYDNIPEATREKLIAAHATPNPRLDVIEYINSQFPHHRIAGMDTSDGLADAITQICRNSGVGARIDRRKINIDDTLLQLTDIDTAFEWVLYGGEDFELVLCLEPEKASLLQLRFGKDCQIIGEITPQQEIVVYDSLGIYPQENLEPEKTFQHFGVY
ncbi:MAG TPA: thiamine-phosphate kinase [Geminocystis sp. M7585_C2015_104]|nr:thiamine-phosphate kinase [Geminocystis sp. M7585_C2015_104]